MKLLKYREVMEALRRKRQKLGIQQKELANRADISPSQLNRMENGKSEANYSTVYLVWWVLQKAAESEEHTTRELMNPDITWIERTDPCVKARKIMVENDFSQLPVRDGANCVGSLTEKDLLYARDPDAQVEEYMSKPFQQVYVETSAESVRQLLKEEPALLVNNDDLEYIGIITKADVI